MRWIKRLLVTLIVLALAVAALVTYLARNSFPKVDGEVTVAGLGHRAEVMRDGWGIPHIYATNLSDLFFAQGYTHAQDRFWQMDFWRHIGAGRLAELFGPDLVDTDVFLRSMGFTEIAEEELATMPPEARDFLQWYAEGVNAYLDERTGSELSLEYVLLAIQNRGYRPEPWTPVHTLTWAKLMSWDLSANMGIEIERTILARTLSIEEIAELYPAYAEDQPVIVSGWGSGQPSGDAAVPESAIRPLLEAGRAANRLWELTGGGFEGIGSNSWVVGGGMTASGMPLLANDTHLGIQMPAIWYANGLHCHVIVDECPYRMVGFTFPGVPGIVIGHNGHVAWGATTQAVDAQDLYLERIDPDDPTRYQVDGEWIPFDRRPETIRVAGGEDHDFEVLSTRHGPVISGIYLDQGDFSGSTAIEEPDDYVVTLRWPTLEPSTLVMAIQGMTGATNLDEFSLAVSLWDIASQNIVFADVEGNIGYHSTGRNPVRAAGSGLYPVPGWDSEHEWTGLIPFEEMPRLLNPSEGFIVSANQPVVRPGSVPDLGEPLNRGQRAARIHQLLEHTSGHDVTSMQDVQMDVLEPGAPMLVSHLVAVPSGGDPAVEVIQAALREWTAGTDAFRSTGSSRGAAAYQATWRHLLHNTFGDVLPEDLLPEGGSRWVQLVLAIVEEPESHWWDDRTTPQVETRDEILVSSMADAHSELIDLLGSNPRNWSWGRLHLAEFRNATFGTSGIAPIEWLFNRRAPLRVGGSPTTVNALGWNAAEGYHIDWIPSFRMVIDLGDFRNSTFIHSTGQSGHAFHPNYDDMIDAWVDGVQAPMLWEREDVLDAARSVLILVPGG